MRRQEIGLKQRELERRRSALEAQIAALRAEFSAAEEEAALIASQDRDRESALTQDRGAAAARRGTDASAGRNGNDKRRKKGSAS